MEFLSTNQDDDGWSLQIEIFAPHEPFFSSAEHKEYYDRGCYGPHFDCPTTKCVEEPPEVVQHARDEYSPSDQPQRGRPPLGIEWRGHPDARNIAA